MLEPRSHRVSTPFGYGSLHTETNINSNIGDGIEERPSDTCSDGPPPTARQGFAHVEFPWGHAYVHTDLVAAVPVFTFYALSRAQHVKFSLPFALTSSGQDMVDAVRQELELGPDIAVALVQTDSVSKHEIAPHLMLGESTIGVGREHPVLVLQTPIMQFDRFKGADFMLLQENNSQAVQVAKGCGSVLGTCSVTCGIKYWEVQLGSVHGGDGVFVGVAREDLALDTSLFASRGSCWGLACATGHKFHTAIEYYADPCKDGDVVGVLLDMESGRLSFYVNGRNLGVAFTGVQVKRLYPVFSLTFIGQQIKLLPTASPPMP
uniref:B30.2/SPRY domain-containing protein n=1 Tax=Hyaloperonospora arabidopsidis (strain Emoy2) TaxID=559515 RepID=M4C065_HYAAE